MTNLPHKLARMRSLVLAGALAVTACGAAKGGSSGADAGTPLPNVADGPVTGLSLNVLDSAAAPILQPGTLPGSGAPTIGANVVLSSVSGWCAAATANANQKSAIQLSLQLYKTDANESYLTLTPGTYTVQDAAASASFVKASFQQDDAMCNLIDSHSATANSGTVTVTSVNLASGGSVAGTFNLAFGLDHVTGSFTAPFCNAEIAGTPRCR